MLKQDKLFNYHMKIVYDHFKGALSGLRQFLANKSPLKIMENVQLKSSSRSQDIYIFVLIFWSCKKRLD